MSSTAEVTFQILFDLYQKQSGSLDELWKFYSTVALALLSAVVASDKLKATPLGIKVIVGGFLFFAASNLVVILKTQATLIELAKAANSLATKSEITKSVQLGWSDVWQVAAFHLLADVAFVCAMWLIYRASHPVTKAAA